MAELAEGLEVEAVDLEKLDDPEVAKLLGQLNASIEENPLQKYFPHERQRLFHETRLKTKCFIGGNRSGKSTATVLDCLIQALDLEVIPEHLRPYRIWSEGTQFKCRFVTPDYGRAFQSVLETIQLWTPKSQLRGGDWEHAFKDKDHVVHFANGSFFEFLTLEQDPDSKFGGSARHRVVYDEEPTGDTGERIREQNIMRLADYRGDELFGFTPVSGELGWVFDEFWVAVEEEGEKIADRAWTVTEQGLLVIQADIDENPHLSAEGRDEALAKIPAGRRAALKSGEFKAAKGLVYEEFDLNLHVVDEANIEPEFIAGLEQIDGIDPGQVETAILFAGIDRHNRLIIYDELTLTGKAAVPEAAAELMAELREGWGLPERAKYTYMDPNSAGARSLHTGERLGEAWKRAGVKVIPAKDDLEAGVREVQRRMNYAVDDGEGGRKPYPLIVISSRCKNLIRQKRKYRQKPKEDGSFGVVKKDDHGPDVERYLAMARPVPVKRRRKRRQASQRYVPGTAPAYQPRRRREGTVVGRFT